MKKIENKTKKRPGIDHFLKKAMMSANLFTTFYQFAFSENRLAMPEDVLGNYDDDLLIMTGVTCKKSPNVYKSCPKMILIVKLKILRPLPKLPKNVRDLGKSTPIG